MKKLYALITCFALLYVLTACHNEYYVVSPSSLKGETLHFLVNGEPLEIPLSHDEACFDTVTLNSEFPTKFVLRNDYKDWDISINGKKLYFGTVDVQLPKISWNDKIRIVISNGVDTRTAYIRTMNSKIPEFTTVGKSPYHGDYYLSFPANRLILKLNEKGEVLYYRCEEPENKKVMSGLYDFKKHYINRNVYYSYLDQSEFYERLVMDGFSGGERVILDEYYNELERITLKAGRFAADGDPVEGHDFYMIKRGHYIVSAYMPVLVHNIPPDLKPNPQGTSVVAAYLQEVKNGSVIFDWISTDYPELYRLTVTDASLTAADFSNTKNLNPDYVHFNSITVDPKDNNLICSFRNLNTILKIDRITGRIHWKLSGKGDEFKLSDQQKTSGQHFVRLTDDGYLTVFDNGNIHKRSRILKYKLDETNKRLVDFREFYVSNHFSIACGSAMLIDPEKNVFVIGWGWGSEITGRIALTEIDFSTNKVLFELYFKEAVPTYRCVKYK